MYFFRRRSPIRGGVDHVNEQWPEFWSDLFAENGFKAFDVIRKLTWKNRDVAYWYRQNMFLFAREDRIHANPKLLKSTVDANDLMFTVDRAILHYRMGVRSISKQLPRSIWSAVSRRFNGIRG